MQTYGIALPPRRSAIVRRVVPRLASAVFALALVACGSSQESGPDTTEVTLPRVEETDARDLPPAASEDAVPTAQPSIDSNDRAVATTNQTPSSPSQPVVPGPASAPLVEPTVPSLRMRDFDSGRFTVAIASKWVEVPGSYRDDFGSLLSLIPEDEAIGRAIDVYRDAVFVPPTLVETALAAHWSALSTAAEGLEWTRGTDETLAGRRVSVGSVTGASSPDRIQEHRVFVCEDGIYSFVLTTRSAIADADRAVLREVLSSIAFKDLVAVRNAARASLPYTAGRPEGWMMSVSGQRAVFRAPLRADAAGKLREHQLSISVTTVSKSHPSQESRQEYARQLALTMLPEGTTPEARDSVTPTTSWGEHLGLATATLVPIAPLGADARAPYRKTVVIFGRASTFVLALHSDMEDKAIAESQLAVFLARFSETK